MIFNILLSSLAAFLIGSIPFSLLIAKYAGGIDLREHGSGNVGATNVTRTMGKRWGMLALLLDAAKGITPLMILPMLIPVDVSAYTHQQVLSGICAVLGHMFPPWLSFRGGKGVATALGVVTVLAPWAMLAALIVFLISFAVKRIVSLSSILAACVFPNIAQFAIHHENLWTSTHWSLGAFSILVPALIIFRHRTNITRLYRGEEQPLQMKKQEPAATENEQEA